MKQNFHEVANYMDKYAKEIGVIFLFLMIIFFFIDSFVEGGHLIL